MVLPHIDRRIAAIGKNSGCRRIVTLTRSIHGRGLDGKLRIILECIGRISAYPIIIPIGTIVLQIFIDLLIIGRLRHRSRPAEESGHHSHRQPCIFPFIP